MASRIVVLLCSLALVLASGAAPVQAAPAPAPPMTRTLLLGAHHPPAPYTGMSSFSQLESTVGRLDVVHYFQAWGGDIREWNAEWLTAAASGGRSPLLTWEPWEPGAGVEQQRYTLQAIASGVHDEYIRSWAKGARAYGKPFHLRFMHEMNGTWYPWGGGVNGGTAAQYVAAWRHVHDLFRANGASNVRWVWSPNSDDVPSSNRLEQFYPGAAYVDVLAVDGYNWGSTAPENGGWRSFEQIFTAPYERLARLGRQPIWIAETGSAPEGGDKAAWVSTMLRSKRFPRLSAIVWFDLDKEKDWRLTSSPAVASAFSAARPRASAGPARPSVRQPAGTRPAARGLLWRGKSSRRD